jgi:hypothetical protein
LNDAADDYQVNEGDLSAGSSGVWPTLTTLVSDQPPGLSATDFQKRWPSEPPPAEKRILAALKENWERAGWQRSGDGVKNDPYRYWRPARPPAE